MHMQWNESKKIMIYEWMCKWYTSYLFKHSGPRLNIKTVLSTYGDFHVKDKTLGRLIFNMGIAIPGKTVFLIETAPWSDSTKVSNLSVYKTWITESDNK